MLLFILAYLGGVLTIVSPCILPVLPFVFARADRPFLTSGLPMLIGMAATFAAVATLAAVAGGWAVAANEYGRFLALALLALFGIALLFPAVAERVTQPLVALGGRLSEQADAQTGNIVPSLLLGVATGLLWAPCAGPVLGLILTGAALNGANVETTVLLFAYAAGAATSLALALLVGGRVFAAMKRSLGAGEWVRRGLGALVLVAVVAIALGVDTNYLTNLSLTQTSAIEQGLIDRLRGQDKTAMAPAGGAMQANPSMMMKGAAPQEDALALPVEGTLPPLDGAVEWLNSAPLSAEALRGKVVLVDFWTYSCINCLRAIPYVRAWAEKYKDDGLVVIGVHTPEFAFEKRPANVKKALGDLKIDYPVAIDNNYAIWRAFNNMYWPAHYFIDAQGHIRHHHFGEGEYDKSEQVIRQLLREAGKTVAAQGLADVEGTGAQAAPDMENIKSPETYLGYDRAENFMSPGGFTRDGSHDYVAGRLKLNDWSLSGTWTVDPEHAALDKAGGAIRYRFHARDLHLVLGPAMDGRPVRFKVTIDGAAPGTDHGVDIDAGGVGTVSEQRLYQLVRQQGAVKERTFEIEFLDPGVQAFAFTFG
ncbi:cytochrome c biogenesis protein, transmembrane region [Afipia carboxidovorans OM5]|uniref:Putative cytochrome biogenesis protein n=1 Tax=Afipia carboxidovorans (strain ATCC 49405 / DSM 1227 / KCTC 32145 / OM5) TaxID=504832 RepID=B6JFP7_AFIC5|nr:cytochrome c biogenesis protein CcdA [Afipia carboxidovorans]ACI93381.1 cytochrome c biogenesis protein, transmembrane region [Afipia carboxidovorans OM5]AEI02902.1 putative cytochrome biogenesis protein [Afipia carboxidovorans OM4]AEI06478.1 putative cytochrome biogenesis protein [Afipia carboxidovorans OM5]